LVTEVIVIREPSAPSNRGPLLFRFCFVEFCGLVDGHFRLAQNEDISFRGKPLHRFGGFYMGSASLKTSPPQGVPLVRKRVQAQKVERKET
jgi:hypothetical protein